MKNLLLVLVLIVVSGCIQNESSSNDVVVVVRPDSGKWVSVSEKEKIGMYFQQNGKIFCGEVNHNEHPMEGVEPSSFEVFAGSKYARDKNVVYYPLRVLCVDGIDWGVCYCTKYVIEGADPVSFKYLGNEYASDKNVGYYMGKRIPESDGNTFKLLNFSDALQFSVDKKNVYWRDNTVEMADPVTFKYDEGNPLNDTIVESYMLKDKDNVWQYNSGRLTKIK